jgi:hypothetical protein
MHLPVPSVRLVSGPGVCLNQHHWLANRMREQGTDFQQGSTIVDLVW